MPGEQDINFRIPSYKPEVPRRNEFPLRVLLYSHDSVGLGHLRRNLAIASEIVDRFPNANVIIVTGSPCATQFELPDRTDLIKIPSITKNDAGHYVCRSAVRSLEPTLELRSQMMLQAFRSFEPHLIIVDHRLIGLKGEAIEMLREAKRNGVLTIYGLRDVKDSPEVVRLHWDNADSRWALAEAYDRICVYGMPEVFDPRVEYAPLLDQTAGVTFTGYIVPPYRRESESNICRQRKKVLVTFGGGSDGSRRANRYLEALMSGPVNWDSHIITGPLMDPRLKKQVRKVARRVQPIGSVKVQRFHHNIPRLLRQVDAVVSMAGYNSCVEIIQSGTPAVLLPRSNPRKEQLIRSSRMSELGWVDFLPDPDPDPAELLKVVEKALRTPRRSRPGVNLDGLDGLCTVILELLEASGLQQETPQQRHS